MRRFKRNDKSVDHPSLLFFRYDNRKAGNKEIWVTPEFMEQNKARAKIINAKQRKKPEHKTRMREYFREYYYRPHQNARQKAYYRKPEVRARCRQKYATDPVFRAQVSKHSKTPKAKAARRAYRQREKAKIKAVQKKYHALKLATDPTYKMRDTYRKRVQVALRSQGVRKNSRTAKMLGCSFEFFRGWIEKQFTEGMHWQNYGNKPGQWEIHHIKPIAAFRLEIPAERDAAFNYANCKPLWSEANRALSDLIEIDGKQIQARKLRTIIPFKAA